MTKTKLKCGKISNDEVEFVTANHENMAISDIATKLRRSENCVRKLIAAVPTIEKTEEQSGWVARLHSSSFWVEVKKGLLGNEIGYFEKAWASFSDQFSSSTDILATDELMIKDLIMLDIFSMRAVAEQANTVRLINELEKAIHNEEQVDDDVRDQMALSNWRKQVTSLSTAKSSLTKHHIDYQKQKDTKLRDLKGSRDQRFKQVEESRRNIFELIKELDTHKRRVQEGHLAAKVAIASENIRKDWNQVIEYEDGTADKPFLSPEGELEDARLQNEQK